MRLSEMNSNIHVIILACRQALPEPAGILEPLTRVGFTARLIPEPCSSKVESHQLLRILASKADLLWVVGCPANACQLVEGSRRMAKRVHYTQDYLKEIGLEAERLGLAFISAGSPGEVEATLQEIEKRARDLGPNPARARNLRAKESL
jgi:F420-non-reducing hydrogenase iron-sulfur subunit